MLTLLPTPAFESSPKPYAEAVSRLASVRHALRLVDDCGGGPAADVDGDVDGVVDGDDALGMAWEAASTARRARFDRQSEGTVAATAAGVEALLMERRSGREPHQEANRALVDQIRRELAEVSRLILG